MWKELFKTTWNWENQPRMREQWIEVLLDYLNLTYTESFLVPRFRCCVDEWSTPSELHVGIAGCVPVFEMPSSIQPSKQSDETLACWVRSGAQVPVSPVPSLHAIQGGPDETHYKDAQRKWRSGSNLRRSKSNAHRLKELSWVGCVIKHQADIPIIIVIK